MNAKDKKIMIIEDEQDILTLFKDFLLKKGFNVLVTSTTAINIVEDYQRYFPDLVIIDYKLPDNRNGIEAIKEILKVDPNAAILLITAYDSVIETFNSEKLFMNKNIKLLIKPVKLTLLEKIVKEIIN